MLAHDGSTDSLVELSENVHQQLNAHFDHMGLMQYEMELLRTQLSEKDRIVSSIKTFAMITAVFFNPDFKSRFLRLYYFSLCYTLDICSTNNS